VVALLYSAIIYRSLYDSRWRASVRVLMFLGVYAAVVWASPRPEPLGDSLENAFGFLFTAVLVQLIAETLRSHGRALKRERILRQLAVTLGLFRDEKTMLTSVLAALHALVSADPTARVCIARGSADDMTSVAAAGDRAEGIREGHSMMSKLPPSQLQALQTNHVIRPTYDETEPTW
jgi:hypothetical protein